jgi:hypothetical protein
VIGEDLDLTVADVPGQGREPYQLQDPAIERVTGISHGDLAFAFLRHERGIALAEV